MKQGTPIDASLVAARGRAAGGGAGTRHDPHALDPKRSGQRFGDVKR